jgi:hypothetical protein
MQIIYDSKGTIFMQGSGFSVPDGKLTYSEVSIPDNQYLVKMDTTKDPVEPVFAEYPKSEMQLMKEQLEQQQADLDYLKLLSGDEEE